MWNFAEGAAAELSLDDPAGPLGATLQYQSAGGSTAVLELVDVTQTAEQTQLLLTDAAGNAAMALLPNSLAAPGRSGAVRSISFRAYWLIGLLVATSAAQCTPRIGRIAVARDVQGSVPVGSRPVVEAQDQSPGRRRKAAVLSAARACDHDQYFVVTTSIFDVEPNWVPELVHVLTDPSNLCPENAAIILAGAAPDAAVEPTHILPLLKSQDELVRASVAAALSVLAPDDPRVIERLLQLLESDEGIVRLAAIEGLAGIGRNAALVIPKLACRYGLSDSEDCAILRAIGSFGPDAGGFVALLEAAIADFPHEATTALSRVGGAGLPALMRALKHPDANVRNWALLAIEYLGPDAVIAAPDVAGLIKTDLSNRRAAIFALAACAPGDGHYANIIANVLRTDDDADVQTVALRALRSIGPIRSDDPREVLLDFLKDDRHASLADDAKRALVAIGADSDVASEFEQRLKDPRESERRRAISWISESRLRSPGVVSALAAICRDNSCRFGERLDAAKALAAIAPSSLDVAALFQGLRIPDGTRDKAIGLAVIQSELHDRRLVPILEKGLRWSGTSDAIRAASHLLRTAPDHHAARELLETRLTDETRLVQLQAAVGLIDGGRPLRRAVEVVLRELRFSSDSERRVAAVSALRYVASPPGSRTRAAIRRSLYDTNKAVRRAAQAVVARLRPI